MKNFKKRVLSGVLAGALAVSMAVPAFAADPSTVLTATYAEPTIEVTVPATGDVVINPFGMPVVVGQDGQTTPADVSIVGAQIVTKPLAIVNNGATDLKVSASVTTETKGDLRLATSKPSSSDTTKSAYVYLQMKNSTVTTPSSVAGNIAGLNAGDVTEEFGKWAQTPYTSSTDLLLSGTAEAKKENMLTLKAGDANGDPQLGSAGLFRLAGQVVASPRDAWATTDGFTATVAFSFKPDLTTATISAETLEIANGATADLTVSLEGATIVSVEWESDKEIAATVAAASTPTDGSKATVTNEVASTASADDTATITATITASNGLTYEVTCDVTCKKA